MYRIAADDQRALIAADSIFQNYARNDIESLHEKNLYQLGEDRMLTTLLLKYFSDMSLSFVPIACCWTMVPDTFKVLLSQRRRWINSTFHNMWQLMKIKIQCGFCCLSMNVIVILDLVFFMILPSGLIYAIIYTYSVIVDDESINIVTIALYIALIGFQMIIFLVRSRIDFIVWFIIYLVLGIPVFYFILPIYSFWNMDDFSWGTTRVVAGDKKGSKGKNGASSGDDTTVAGYGAGDLIKEETMEDDSQNSSNGDHPPAHGVSASQPRTQRRYNSTTQQRPSDRGHRVDIDALSDDIETAIPREVRTKDVPDQQPVFDDIYGDLPTSSEGTSRSSSKNNNATRKAGGRTSSLMGSSSTLSSASSGKQSTASRKSSGQRPVESV